VLPVVLLGLYGVAGLVVYRLTTQAPAWGDHFTFVALMAGLYVLTVVRTRPWVYDSIELTPIAIVIRFGQSRGVARVPWADVRAIAPVKKWWGQRVQITTHNGSFPSTRMLPVPCSEFLFADPDFDERAATIIRWWEHHRGVQPPLFAASIPRDDSSP